MSDNIKINSSLMYDFNPHFYEVKSQLKSIMHYKFKTIFPDYMYENFFLMDEESKEAIISFLNIFMQVIINKLKQIISFSEKIYLPKKTYHFKFESKLDILNFFKSELNIHPVFTAEKMEEYHSEKNRFILGKNSKLSIKASRLGNKIKSTNKNIYFYVDISRENMLIFIEFFKNNCPKFSILINQNNTLNTIKKRYYFVANATSIINVFCI